MWGWDFGDTSTVTVHVRRLREKLEHDPSDPRLVLTVGRSGYRIVGEDEDRMTDFVDHHRADARRLRAVGVSGVRGHSYSLRGRSLRYQC